MPGIESKTNHGAFNGIQLALRAVLQSRPLHVCVEKLIRHYEKNSKQRSEEALRQSKP